MRRSASTRPRWHGLRPPPARGHRAGPGGRADRLGDGPARLERRERLPGASAPTATTTAARSTTCRPWNNAGRALRPRGRAGARARARARLRDAGGGPPRGSGGLLCCALDTELLGHWWYEGQAWLGAVVEEARAQGVRLVTVSEGIELVAPVAARARALDLGARQGLHDLGRAGGGRAGLRGARRRAAHRGRRGGARRRRTQRSSAPPASCSRCSRATGPSWSRATWPPTTPPSGCACTAPPSTLRLRL